MSLKLSGLVSGMDTESMVSELMKAQRQRTTKLDNKITTLDWKQEKWKTLNTKIYSFYTGALSKMRFQGNYNTKSVSSTADSLVSVTASNTAIDGTHSLKIKQLASSQYVTGDKLELDENGKAVSRSTLLSDLNFATDDNNQITITGPSKTVTFDVNETATVGKFLDSLKSAGINASYDSTQKRFFLSSNNSGTANAFTMTASTAGSLEKLGLSDITKTVVDGNVTINTGANVKAVNPADSIVYYNGAELRGSTNTISANGLTLQLKGVTSGLTTPDTADDQVINLNVSKDTKAVYDMVKNFVKGYNELLQEMNDAYNAKPAKGFNPLTEEQKETMTDTQIEKWEDKIKDALLRRDTSLSSVLNSMKTDLTGNVTIDGKNYALSNYGIGTLEYTEKGLLHIDGDSDDPKVSSEDNKLMKALTDNPDQVVKVLTGLTDKLYKSMTDKMKSTTLRSALNVYNDKEITNTQRDQKSKLKTLEAKLAKLESKYYKQFSKMESAMSELNSQSSSLTSMLGG